MTRGRKPYAEWDDNAFRSLWYDRSITLVEMAKRMNRRAVRPLLRHARALDLPPRRDIEGPVGERPKSHWFESGVHTSYEVSTYNEPSFASFVCSVCGMRSSTPVHPVCEERQRANAKVS